LAKYTTDTRAREALESLAGDFERKAAEIERQRTTEGEQKPTSRSDTP
jgi:hypothetical protein